MKNLILRLFAENEFWLDVLAKSDKTFSILDNHG